VVLCGDAAGFVHPLTGEGIYYAMASGEIASKVVTEAMECGEYTGQRLSEYQVAWMEDFGKELIVAASIQKLVVASIQKRFGGATRILEIGTKMAEADEDLTKMMADLCLGRDSINKALIGRFLSRMPISTSKYLRKKLFNRRDS
jgi:flavin-dependent dehydrogenase